MTERELRTQLNNLAGDMPDETHRAFLSAISSGKDEVVMKKKFSAVLAIAILLSLVTFAFAANEILQTFSVTWDGEVEDEPFMPDEGDQLKKMLSLFSAVPEDRYAVIESNGTSPRLSKGINITANTLAGIEHPGLILPDDIENRDSFIVNLNYGCRSEGEYRLVKEETIDGFKIKQYAVESPDDILTGYQISYKGENGLWHLISSRLIISQASQFSFDNTYGEEYSAEPVEIPGMNKAVFITRGLNYVLMATRTLDNPVILKTAPAQYISAENNDTTEYPYELIELEGFTLDECMKFFQAE